MNYLEFFEDALKQGRVLGIAPQAVPVDVKAKFGNEFMEDMSKNRKVMRWDYGLIEFTFSRFEEWICTTISIQVHRLASHGSSVVPPAVRAVYGSFPDKVHFEDLRGFLIASGCELRQEPVPGSGFDGYSISGTSNILYVATSDDFTGQAPNRGDVWGVAIRRPLSAGLV